MAKWLTKWIEKPISQCVIQSIEQTIYVIFFITRSKEENLIEIQNVKCHLFKLLSICQFYLKLCREREYSFHSNNNKKSMQSLYWTWIKFRVFPVKPHSLYSAHIIKDMLYKKDCQINKWTNDTVLTAWHKRKYIPR